MGIKEITYQGKSVKPVDMSADHSRALVRGPNNENTDDYAVLDLETNQVIQEFLFPKNPYPKWSYERDPYECEIIALSPCGKYLSLIDSTRDLQITNLYNIDTGERIFDKYQKFDPDSERYSWLKPTPIAFSNDGKLLVMQNRNETVTLLNIEDSKIVTTIDFSSKEHSRFSISKCEFSETGQYVMIKAIYFPKKYFFHDERTTIYNTQTGKVVKLYDDSPNSITFSKDESCFVARYRDRWEKVETSSGKLIEQGNLYRPAHLSPPLVFTKTHTATLSANNHLIIYSESRSLEIKIKNPFYSNRPQMKEQTAPYLVPYYMKFTPCNKYLAVMSRNPDEYHSFFLTIYDSEKNWDEVYKIENPTSYRFSNNNRYLAITRRSIQGTDFIIFDTNSWAQIRSHSTLPTSYPYLIKEEFLSDGRLLACNPGKSFLLDFELPELTNTMEMDADAGSETEEEDTGIRKGLGR